MVAGVPFPFFVVNMAVAMEAFLVTGNLWALPIALPIHGVGYRACLREPRLFNRWLARVGRARRARARTRRGGRSAEPRKR